MSEFDDLLKLAGLEYLEESTVGEVRTRVKTMSDEEFKNLLQYDPDLYNYQGNVDDAPESFLAWIIRMYKAGKFNGIAPENVRELLKNFKVVKNWNVLPSKDINFYKSFDSLYTPVQQALEHATSSQKTKSARRAKKNIENPTELGMYLDNGLELLYQCADWNVWTPHTYEGSCAIRRGATWCTGSTTDSGYYDSYTRRGELFEFVNRNNFNDKYQLFVDFDGDEKEFRNADNEAVKFRAFIHENPDLIPFCQQNKLISLAYPDIDDETIDDDFDESMEEEIFENYNLRWEDGGDPFMPVRWYYIICNNCLLSEKDIEDFFKNGYFEGYDLQADEYDFEQFCKIFTQSEAFLYCCDWQDNEHMEKLYNIFVEKSGYTGAPEHFFAFLFQTNMPMSNRKYVNDYEFCKNWCEEHLDIDVDEMLDEVFEAIEGKYYFCDYIGNEFYKWCMDSDDLPSIRQMDFNDENPYIDGYPWKSTPEEIYENTDHMQIDYDQESSSAIEEKILSYFEDA